MECVRFSNNMKHCPCTYEPCEKKGHCCECISYHKENGELPACYFTPEEEATFDRSIQNFIKSRK